MKAAKRLFIVLLGMLAASPVWSADQQAAVNALKEARSLFDKAVAEQGGWVTTKSLLTDAELAITKGDYGAAVLLADKAKREAELSYSQALSEQTNWTEPSFLK